MRSIPPEECIMNKKIVVWALSALISVPSFSQEQDDIYGERHETLDSVIVSSSRAGKSTPVTYTMVGKDELRLSNPSASLPMALSLQPSVVTYNEGGTGLGNSAMTIRGVKGSQINVTLNGVTLNDAESQEVFWVNIPSLTSLISTVQLQRGLGTSASGSGAFGASVNMNTAFVTPAPYGSVDLSGGSYNTFMATVSAGTGLTSKGLYASAAYSRGMTDGYIRNAFVGSQSAFVTLGYLKGRNSLKFTYLMGDQRSGITWDGISLSQYQKDRRHNDAGAYEDKDGNTQYYDNQTDNYTQHHLQLNYTRSLSDPLTWTTTLNYTRGDGYDEYLKTGKNLSKYGIHTDPPVEGDVIYRKRMGNNYYVLNSDLRYRSENLDLTGGISLSRYDGVHDGIVGFFGPSYDPSRVKIDFSSGREWYDYSSTKNDNSAFVRGEKKVFGKGTLYADLQYRRVDFKMRGIDDDFADIGYDDTWNFFNPRAGLSWDFSPSHRVYASVALGHREPGRSDIKENIKGEAEENPIRPEKMIDIEASYRYSGSSFSASAGVYLMEYQDILLETGRLSSSGYAIKENVPRGWRRGIELASAWTPMRWIRLDANMTLSTNRLKDYTSYVEVSDGEEHETHPVNYGETDMLLSPSVIGMAKLTFFPIKRTTLSIDGKYVGRQFIDNTMRKEMEIPAYFVANITASYDIPLPKGILTLTGYVNNIFNNMYYAYGWRWESYSKATGEIYSGIGVYPQAPCNALLKLSYRF